ncbi:PHP domain-containing protein [Lachnospiraceae bacterium OttesenSCG-928-D06]|nr:PHP domain-containing protein [Lachnospiraceae bacterium OttesenSCG-928-D06]
MLPIDIHTHSAASGHGTTDTITHMAKAAAKKGMAVLGFSDHGPATPGSCKESFFRSLLLAPKERFGIRLLYGIEANIIDENGTLDVENELLAKLDFCIASLHSNVFPLSEKASPDLYTTACINAMKNPYVKILGHIDDTNFPKDHVLVAKAAIASGVILELNEVSISPDGYRGNARPNAIAYLTECIHYKHPILLSSDSHGSARIGETPYSLELLESLNCPKSLILNNQDPDTWLTLQ